MMSTQIFNYQTSEVSIYYYDNNYATRKALRFDYSIGKIYCNTIPDQLLFVDDPTIEITVDTKTKGQMQSPTQGSYPIEAWGDTYYHTGDKVVDINVSLTPNEEFLIKRINSLQTNYLYNMTDVFDRLDYNNGQKITNKNQQGPPYIRD